MSGNGCADQVTMWIAAADLLRIGRDGYREAVVEVNRARYFQVFKYAVYVLLAMNVYWFFTEEVLAARLLYPHGVGIRDLIGAFPATIDTASWVVLLLMFELETYVLEDDQFTKPVTWSLHGLRAICYAFIVYAFYGYIGNLVSVQAVTSLPGISDLCALAGTDWSYSVSLEEYTAITLQNCANLSGANVFVSFDDARAVVDRAGLSDIQGLAWIDVLNSAVWLLVVLILELDVRLQERNLLEGLALRLSTAAKVVLYATLLYAAIYWGVKGDFVDFWDAFLWLVAFVFIELNVFEWRHEELEHVATDGTG
jgi:hypothetical protein